MADIISIDTQDSLDEVKEGIDNDLINLGEIQFWDRRLLTTITTLMTNEDVF